MKTLFILTALTLVSAIGLTRKEKVEEANPPRSSSSKLLKIDERKTFAPFSWQTKWFKEDLNHPAKFNIKGGC